MLSDWQSKLEKKKTELDELHKSMEVSFIKRWHHTVSTSIVHAVVWRISPMPRPCIQIHAQGWQAFSCLAGMATCLIPWLDWPHVSILGWTGNV